MGSRASRADTKEARQRALGGIRLYSRAVATPGSPCLCSLKLSGDPPPPLNAASPLPTHRPPRMLGCKGAVAEGDLLKAVRV